MHRNSIAEPVPIWPPLQYFQRTYFLLRWVWKKKVEICCQTHKVETEYSRRQLQNIIWRRKETLVELRGPSSSSVTVPVCRELLGGRVGEEERRERPVGRQRSNKGKDLIPCTLFWLSVWMVNCCIWSRRVPWLALNSKKLILLGECKQDETRGRRPNCANNPMRDDNGVN